LSSHVCVTNLQKIKQEIYKKQTADILFRQVKNDDLMTKQISKEFLKTDPYSKSQT